jgi:hypothetical protein
MAEGEDDDPAHKKLRSNIDHDPKPSDQARRNVSPRGVVVPPGPSLTPGGPGGMGGYRPPQRPSPRPRPNANDVLMGASRKAGTGDVPIAPKPDDLAPTPQFKRNSYDLPKDMDPKERAEVEKRVAEKLAEIQQANKNKHKR